AAQLPDVLPHDQDLGVVLQRPAQAGVERLADGHGLHQCSPPAKDERYSANRARSSSTSGDPFGYTLSKRLSGSGSGMASTRSRRGVVPAPAVACRPTAAKPASPPAPGWERTRRIRRIGSLACHASTSLAIRYRDGSSELVCAPIR